MNRKDIQELRVHCGYPAITIIMPCDKGQIELMLQKLLDDVREVEPEVLKTIKDQSKRLIDAFACPMGAFKIALFIDRHRGRSFAVPLDVPDVAVCDTSFRLDAILSLLNRTFCFWVIDTTGRTPRLLEGMGGTLNELDALCITFDKAVCPYTQQESCFDACVNHFLEQDRLPLCIVGKAEKIERLAILAPYAEQIVMRVTSLEEVVPAMERWHAAETERVLNRITTGKHGEDFISEFQKILVAARQGFVQLFVVEQGYMRAGCEHPVTRAVLLNTQCPTGYVSISAIDQLIEAVKSKGGRVLVVADGMLTTYGKMVAFTNLL